MDFEQNRLAGSLRRLKTGLIARNNNILGLGFSSYTKWFVGFRI